MKALVILALFGISSACYNQPQPPVPDTIEGEILLSSKPDKKRGQNLYLENCVPCHGEEGHGDGWRVKELEGPKPRDFHNNRTMGRMSPQSAYLAITRGVPRSAMGAFDLLAPEDRWHLAYYVMSLAHSQEAAARGQESIAALKLSRSSALELTQLGNQAVLQHFMQKGQAEAEARNLLAYLRQNYPYEKHPFGLDSFRTELSRSIATYRKGEHESAKAILLAGSLDKLHSHLELMRSRASGVVLAIEYQVRALHNAYERGLPLAEIEPQVRALTMSLDMASPVLSKIESQAGLALGAAIALSFGLDGALFLFLLITLVSRRGADKRERKVLGAGIAIGGIASLALAILWPSAGISGSLRNTISLGVSSIALGMSLLLLAGIVRHFRWPPQTRTVAAPSWFVLLFLFSGGLLVRDTLEFIPTIRLFPNSALWLGAIAAILSLALLIVLLVALERRLEISARIALLAITASSLAVVSAGSAARTAQLGQYLASDQIGVVQSPWLSLWPTSQGILFQLAAAALCTVILITFTLMRSKSPTSA